MARKSTKWLAVLAVGLTPAAAVITGCGAGGSNASISTSGQTAERGVLTLKVTFPKRNSRSATPQHHHAHLGRPSTGGSYDGSIPLGTLSVKVALVNPTTGAALAVSQVIQAPPGDDTVTSPQTVSFTNLPAGPVRIQVRAFPTVQADAAKGPGEANPIALGSTDAQIVANQTVAARVLLQLTIDHVTLTPTFVTLVTLLGQNSVILTAQAFDRNNALLIYPFTFDSSDTETASVTPLSAQTVEVDANSTGTATITATEINSLMFATSTVTVTGSGGGGGP